MQAGVRELRDNLSRYIRRIAAGERIVITAHGRAVAELVPPTSSPEDRIRPIDRLVASGTIVPAMEDGDPLEQWPDIRLQTILQWSSGTRRRKVEVIRLGIAERAKHAPSLHGAK